MTRCRTSLPHRSVTASATLRGAAALATAMLALVSLGASAQSKEEETPPPVRVIQAPMSAHYEGREFPPETLRGELEIVSAPQAKLGGKPVQLAPGFRLYDELNRLLMTAQLAGRKVKINYRTDFLGQVSEAWVLSDAEQKRLWPTKVEEAAKWRYDPVWKTWAKS